MSKKADVKLICDLANIGKTVKEIAIETGYSEGTIRKHLKELNIKAFSNKTYVSEEILEEIIKLNKLGLTNKQIADKLNMVPSTVRKYLKQNNLETHSLRTKRISEKDIILTQEQIEVIYGSLLGDMNIGINWKNARITITHGTGQEEYFDHKCSIFKNILGKVNKTPRFDKRTNKYYNRYSVRLLSHPIFTKIYNECYINGVKTVTKEWLNKITPRGLAFWFMDDGNNRGILAVNSFSYEECLLIQQWFKDTYNISTTIEHQKNKGGIQYILYIKAESRPTFYKLVEPYIIPSMQYKFKNWNP